MRFALAMSIFVSLVLAAAAFNAEAADAPGVSNAVGAGIANASTGISNASAAAIANAPATAITNAPAAAETETGENAAKPAHETPEGLHVSVKDEKLSVNVKDQPFGKVIGEIAKQAEFDVDISNDVFDKKLSTMFSGIGLERGIQRLLSLIGQKNYFMNYRPDGSIKSIEIYGDLGSGQRTLSGSQKAPTAAPAPAGNTETRRPPSSVTPSPIVIKQRERKRQGLIKGATGQAPKEPEEPAKAEEVLELEYKIRKLPQAADEGASSETKTETEETTPTTTPTTSETPTTSTTPTDVIEEEIIPEGDIPPESTLMNAPYMPPSGSPVVK